MEIRLLKENRELEAAERLQQMVWGGPSLVPATTMRATLEVGGCVIGAWDGDRLVGFCFGFPGWRERRPLPPGLERGVPAGEPPAGPGLGEQGFGPPAHHPPAAAAPPPVPGGGVPREPVFHSDMLAVDPAYRDRGIGRRLKWTQRRWALEQGLYLITWTYDPLQTRNGFLNLTRLGGVARRYLREFYGAMDDDINRGLPSDRLLIEWYLDSDRVARRAAAAARGQRSGGTAGARDSAGTAAPAVPGPGRAAPDAATAGSSGAVGAPGAPGGSGSSGAGTAPGVAPVPAPGASLGDLPLPLANRVRTGTGGDGLPEPGGWELIPEAEAVAVEVPTRFAEWRVARPDWGLRWRFHLREVLEAYLAAGYLLDGCEPLRPGAPTTRYILRRRATVEVPAW